MNLRSGLLESMPYSLSRWTDVPAAKWEWFERCLATGSMAAFDQRTALPNMWSLNPDDVLSLVWWTKNPRNLIDHVAKLRPYRNLINLTITGWEEVEKGAPTRQQAKQLLTETVAAYGPGNVVWRFSPVPILPEAEVLDRYADIAQHAYKAGLRRVFLSFIQSNDLITEPRTKEQKVSAMFAFANAVPGIEVLLCQDDRDAFLGMKGLPTNLQTGICVAPDDFDDGSFQLDTCGCVMMVDPFTINESCTMGCRYCYAADKSLSDQKRNTTRKLPVLK